MLSVQHLAKHYRGVALFSQFQWHIEPGRYWLQGANGSGKSTLLRILAMLEPCEQGTLLWQGQQVNEAWARQHVSISADAIDFPGFLSLRTLCHYWLKQYPDALLEPLLQGFALEAVLDREWQHASVGQRKKLSLALALSRPCPVLLLDEPANGLDVAALAFLGDVVHSHPATVQIMVSHQAQPWLEAATVVQLQSAGVRQCQSYLALAE